MEPVGIASTLTMGESPNRMMLPLPNSFSSLSRVSCKAFSFSVLTSLILLKFFAKIIIIRGNNGTSSKKIPDFLKPLSGPSHPGPCSESTSAGCNRAADRGDLCGRYEHGVDQPQQRRNNSSNRFL